MRNNKFTRRDFLKVAGMASASLTLSACGVKSTDLSTPTALSSLTPSPTASNTPIPTPTITATPHPPTLREIADKAKIELGMSFVGQLFNEPKFYDILKSSFNLTVIDWGLYWNKFEPTQGSPNYSTVDKQLKALEKYNLKESLAIRGHPLYFPELNPDWLLNGNFSKTELIDILKKHITEIVSRFKGVIKQWVVVNEPYLPNHPDWRPKDILYQKIGIEYIDIAFQAAREADPSAILIFNETDNYLSNGYSTRQSLEIVNRLGAKDLIDGVGCHMHLKGAKPPDLDNAIKTMQSYGIPIYATELDVDLSNVQGDNEERFAKQAKIYSDVLTACIDSKVCNSITFWEMVDKYSWLEQNKPNADATLFDDNIQPKPSYFAVKEVLEKYAGG